MRLPEPVIKYKSRARYYRRLFVVSFFSPRRYYLFSQRATRPTRPAIFRYSVSRKFRHDARVRTAINIIVTYTRPSRAHRRRSLARTRFHAIPMILYSLQPPSAQSSTRGVALIRRRRRTVDRCEFLYYIIFLYLMTCNRIVVLRITIALWRHILSHMTSAPSTF